MKKRESIDLALILIWPVIAAIFSFLFRTNAFWALIIFFVVPCVYLSYRGKQYIKKVLLFAFSTTILLMIMVEYLAELNSSWFVPLSTTIFPFTILQYVVVEVILWAFLTSYFVVMFYEYFINKHKTRKIWSQRMTVLSLIFLVIFIFFLFLYFLLPHLLIIPYFYLWFGVVLVLIPFLIQLFRYPRTTSKFFLAAIYFFYFHFILEITGLKLGFWSFPGTKFIGWVSVLGISFPIEELIFWFILLALGILSYYEFFDDDEK